MKKITPLLLVLAGTAAAGHGSAAEPSKERPLDSKFLRDYAETRGFMLGRPVSPKPTPDGKSVLFLRATPRVRKMSLFEFDVATGRSRELLSAEMILKGAEEKLSPEEKARRERMRVTLGGITSFQLTEDGKRILIGLSGKLYLFERAAGSVQELKTGQGTILDPKFSPNGKLVGYVRDYDVYAYDLGNDKEHRVTTGGTQRVSHGLAEFVAQEEMDRYSGYWWSPDSKFIAYEEADATAVETWHVADPFNPDQPPQPVFYPRPGKNNVTVRVGVIPVAGGDTVWIKWDDKKYPYLAQVRWDKHGPLTLTVQTREQQEILLLKSDPNSGKTSALLTEKNPAWINLHQEVPRWWSDSKGFVWISETEAAPQLELRDAEGKRQRVLVPAKRAFQRLVGFDDETGAFAYQASPVPIESQIHIQLANGIVLEPQDSLPTAVMTKPAVETAVFSEGFRRYILSRTSATTLPRSTLHELTGAPLGALPSLADTPSFKPKVELLKVGDDSGYYCSIVRPHGFDARNKYPVIVDVYGGPHHLHVQAAMGSFLLR